MTLYTQTASDTAQIGGTSTTAHSTSLAVTTAIVVTPIKSAKLIARPVVADRLKFLTSSATTGLFHYALRASLKLRANTGSITSIIAHTLLRLTGMAQSRLLLRVLDAVNLSAQIAVGARLSQRLQAALTLHGVSVAAWRKAVADHLHLTGLGTNVYTAQISTAEQIILHATTHATMIVQVVDIEGLILDDPLEALRALYRNVVFDVVNLSIGLQQPNGTVTTWAINARSGAVSEYTNFAYDSFARQADGSYIGAGADGTLYALAGDTDNSAPIIADIMGGLMDMGGSRFTQLKAAYLGVRGTGTFYLRIVTDSETVRTYEVKVKSLTTARVDVGKGLRSRYLQWELLSTGQDFDLDAIEFVPLVSTRRI